jgi:hypothetical protein
MTERWMRPVYVLAVGHDLDAADAERIQQAVMLALGQTEGPEQIVGYRIGDRIYHPSDVMIIRREKP